MPTSPYRGLSYYGVNDERVFAGRDQDVVDCYHLLMTSNILVLHGKTGCGKSSFLRAGLAPYMRKQQAVGFVEGREGGALFVRSGARPLRSLAREVWDLIERSDAEEAKLETSSPESYVECVVKSHEELVKSLGILTEHLYRSPVLIIDQAEEIFTAVDHDSLDGGMEEEAREYYFFLARMSSVTTGVRLCVTLRTEYKGRLDDQMDRYGSNRAAIEGYYLGELDREGMLQAIGKPTAEFKFSFETGVPEAIVDAIAPSHGDIPIGGRLPALQVMCLRLWQIIQEGHRTKITKRDFENLGLPARQIEFYIEDKLREVLTETIFDRRRQDYPRMGEQVDKWRFVLASLATEETDGRVLRIPRSKRDIIEQIKTDGFLADIDVWHRIIERLSEDDIGLFASSNESSRQGDDVSLVHDAVGLVLVRWINSRPDLNKEDDRIGADPFGETARWSRSDLFESKEELEEFVIETIDDPIWDHRLHIFAGIKEFKEFAERLGIVIRPVDDEIHWRRDMQILPEKLSDLANRSDNTSFLYSLPPEIMKKIRKSQDDGWSEILIPNLYYGLTLIGSASAIKTRDGRPFVEYSQGPAKAEDIERWLEDLGCELQTHKVGCLDDAGRAFFKLIKDICGSSAAMVDPVPARDMMAHVASGGFVIGSANERALAERSGFRIYLTGDEVRQIIETLPQVRLPGPRLELVRRTHVHNVWNVKPAGNARGSEAFRLRLASIGFYACEYVRRYPEDYSGFLWSSEAEPPYPQGVPLDQTSIRSTVGRSYRWAAFEDYGPAFLDKASDDSLPMASDSVRDVYEELLDKRRLCMKLARDIDKLIGGELPECVKRLKLRAWNHYRIFNFYDAERILREALSAAEGSRGGRC